MTKLISLIARFPSHEAYLYQSPSEVVASYLDGGTLNKQDARKMQNITRYYLENDLYPAFVITTSEEMRPLIGEATIDFDMWTWQGMPRFKMRGLEVKKGPRK